MKWIVLNGVVKYSSLRLHTTFDGVLLANFKAMQLLLLLPILLPPPPPPPPLLLLLLLLLLSTYI